MISTTWELGLVQRQQPLQAKRATEALRHQGRPLSEERSRLMAEAA